MSNHHSQRSINLHHSQVDAARQRKASRQSEREEKYRLSTESGHVNEAIVKLAGFMMFLGVVMGSMLFVVYWLLD